jgi:hypothetical protein
MDSTLLVAVFGPPKCDCFNGYSGTACEEGAASSGEGKEAHEGLVADDDAGISITAITKPPAEMGEAAMLWPPPSFKLTPDPPSYGAMEKIQLPAVVWGSGGTPSTKPGGLLVRVLISPDPIFMVPVGSYEFSDVETGEVTFNNLQFVGHHGQDYDLRFVATTAEGKSAVAGPFKVTMQACPEGTSTDPDNQESCICLAGHGILPKNEGSIDTDGNIVEERRGRGRRLDGEETSEGRCQPCLVGTYSAEAGYGPCVKCNTDEGKIIEGGTMDGKSLWTAQEGATSAAECKPAGCTDPTAANYDATVFVDDISCIFDISDGENAAEESTESAVGAEGAPGVSAAEEPAPVSGDAGDGAGEDLSIGYDETGAAIPEQAGSDATGGGGAGEDGPAPSATASLAVPAPAPAQGTTETAIGGQRIGSRSDFLTNGGFFRVTAVATGADSGSLLTEVGLQEQYKTTAAALIGVEASDLQVMVDAEDGSVTLTLIILSRTSASTASIDLATRGAGFETFATDLAVSAGHDLTSCHQEGIGGADNECDLHIDTSSVVVDTIDGPMFIQYQEDDDTEGAADVIMVPSRLVMPTGYSEGATTEYSSGSADSRLRMQAAAEAQGATEPPHRAGRSIRFAVDTWVVAAAAAAAAGLLAVVSAVLAVRWSASKGRRGVTENGILQIATPVAASL